MGREQSDSPLEEILRQLAARQKEAEKALKERFEKNARGLEERQGDTPREDLTVEILE